MALPFAGIRLACMSRQWDGNPLGLGLVAEHKPSEFSWNYVVGKQFILLTISIMKINEEC